MDSETRSVELYRLLTLRIEGTLHYGISVNRTQ